MSILLPYGSISPLGFTLGIFWVGGGGGLLVLEQSVSYRLFMKRVWENVDNVASSSGSPKAGESLIHSCVIDVQNRQDLTVHMREHNCSSQ